MLRFLPLQQALKDYWGQDKGFLVSGKPDQAVAQGAAVYSYLKSRHRDFVLKEPSADAYYVKKKDGFDALLGRGHQDKGEKKDYRLTGDASILELQVFAGDEIPLNGDKTSIYPSLVYQGKATVHLQKKYPTDTKVWIQASYPADSELKMPSLNVWINTPDNLIATISYDQLQDHSSEAKQ